MSKSLRNALIVVVALGVVAALVVLVVSGPKKQSAATTTTTVAKKKSYPLAPLTGLPDPSRAALHRAAMTVKIENDPNSLPQFGVNEADVVYEEIVNGGITRLAAIFNQNAPAKIGPVRSVRPTDTQVVWPLGGLFVFSGGAQYAINSIETAPVKLIDEDAAGAAMFRDPNRVAPYNLYGIGPALFKFGGTPVPPKALFKYRKAGMAIPGEIVKKFVVPFPSIYPVTWTWDAATDSWNRGMDDFTPALTVDRTGTGQIESPKNVIVMHVKYYGELGAMNSYADLQGSGAVTVFTGGHMESGTWSRGASKGDIIQYRNAKGVNIRLTPGQTWVELLNTGAPALTIVH